MSYLETLLMFEVSTVIMLILIYTKMPKNKAPQFKQESNLAAGTLAESQDATSVDSAEGYTSPGATVLNARRGLAAVPTVAGAGAVLFSFDSLDDNKDGLTVNTDIGDVRITKCQNLKGLWLIFFPFKLDENEFETLFPKVNEQVRILPRAEYSAYKGEADAVIVPADGHYITNIRIVASYVQEAIGYSEGSSAACMT